MAQNDAENTRHGTIGKNGSNTANKVPGNVPFAKGHDPRRNLKGRPKSFDQARALALDVLHKELQTKDGGTISVVEAILTSWAKSKDLQKSLIELAFGKVPDKIESTGLESKTTLVLHWPHERQDLAAAPPSNGQSNGRS